MSASESRAEFASEYFRDRRGKAWCVRGYQGLSLESRALRKVHCDGRDVGKTSEIEIVAAWASVALPNREMLIATQCENHLFPLMDCITKSTCCQRAPVSHLPISVICGQYSQ